MQQFLIPAEYVSFNEKFIFVTYILINIFGMQQKGGISSMQSPTEVHPLIADYDADNYDYRTHWKKRAYEQWAESFVLERLLVRIRQAQWLIDFGGGFGRNTIHYSQRTRHAVLVDYSLGNLKRTAATYAADIERGHLFLIRADLYHLPFIDRAFDVGLIVRVLHHLAEVGDALREMERVLY